MIGLTHWKEHRKPRVLADEQEHLSAADSNQVSVPIAQPSVGRRGHIVVELLEAVKQPLSAPQYDHADPQRNARGLTPCRPVGVPAVGPVKGSVVAAMLRVAVGTAGDHQDVCPLRPDMRGDAFLHGHHEVIVATSWARIWPRSATRSWTAKRDKTDFDSQGVNDPRGSAADH
jgi:hypothetical protein